MTNQNKVVLAYSGGLDTSVMIPWLKETYGLDVIAYVADVGQNEDFSKIEEKAYKTGASKVYVDDLKEEFISNYVFPTLRARAIYEDKYLLGTSFARPLIAKRQIEIAQKEGAGAVSHGATGKGNDQVRFELTYMALDPSIKIIAPWKDPKWAIKSREDALAYAKARNIEIQTNKNKIYSEDLNAWHISHEGLDLEDPKNEPKDLWSLTCSLDQASDTPEYVEIEYKKGNPVSVNGEKLTPHNLVKKLNKIGSKHAIGQIDLVENRLVGMKSRGVYETPGGTILYAAQQALETLVLDRETYHYKQQISLKYADLVYNGQWFTPLREAFDCFNNSVLDCAEGKIKLKLYKGNIINAGISSPNSLYSTELATFSQDEIYDQKDATGFIKLFGLPLKMNAILRGKK